jgi:hypothetical protein
VTGYGLDIATGYGLTARVRFSAHTDSGAHPASYPMVAGGFFPGGKVAGA